jgi:ribosome biogenesis GTPase / thiamine phosphate phosphatase
LTSSSAFPASSDFSALAPYGWDEAWVDTFAPYGTEGLLPGRVIRVDRGQCDVVTADGVVRADTAFVTPHDPLRVVCTGDWVALEPGGNPRYVRAYLPRRTAFVRSTSSKRWRGRAGRLRSGGCRQGRLLGACIQAVSPCLELRSPSMRPAPR